MKLKMKITLKRLYLILLTLNSLTIIFGIVYITSFDYNFLWDVEGVLIITTWLVNLYTCYYVSPNLSRNAKYGKTLKYISYIYPLTFAVSMPLMLFGNFFLSVSYSLSSADNLLFYLMLYPIFFGNLLLMVCFSLLLRKSQTNEVLKKKSEKIAGKNQSKKLKYTKYIIQIAVLILFIIGIYFCYILFAGDPGLFGMFFPELALGAGFGLLATTIVGLKTINRKKNSKAFWAYGLIGITLSGILALPYSLTPIDIYFAEVNFNEAFGSDWREKIHPSINQFFLKTHYSTPQYFLGINPKHYAVIKDVLYFDGNESPYEVDENITLYFDVYMPSNKGIGLPGENSTLIRIHGGSWRSYDKGVGSMMQMNKYFAAQGYIVFDIQYGLHRPERNSDLLTPINVLGNFTIDDMLRHIGNFTFFLAENADLYGANLDSVFISGGSAGGHLTCATALAINSGNYSHLFSSDLKIKGLIPFYPANLLPLSYGTPELIRPEMLVTSSSPPCLIFQGTQDGLVHWSISQRFKDTYTENNNDECAVIYFLLAGHANDIYFSGHFNVVFLYFMERFMYIYL